MKIALLTTGDEIVHGDILNTNSYNLAHAFTAEGLSVNLHLTCTDNESEIYNCLNFLDSTHDILIITGGLGPTSDDRTRFAVSRFLAAPLIEYPEAVSHIKDRLSNQQALSKGNHQQALFPSGAILLPNPNGTALGFFCTKNNKSLFLLPGPPRECLPMFNDYILPYLKEIILTDKQLLKWRVFGIAESQIAEQLDQALQGLDCETGYRYDLPYVECKVRFQPALLDTIKKIVEPIVSPCMLTTNEQKASEQLREAVLKWQKTISIQDEVSGGLLQTLLLRPENCHLINFHQQQNSDFTFHIQGLKEYWTGQQAGGMSRLLINYRCGQQQGIDQYELPFRNSLVVHYAAEWLCYRLFHLIKLVI